MILPALDLPLFLFVFFKGCKWLYCSFKQTEQEQRSLPPFPQTLLLKDALCKTWVKLPSSEENTWTRTWATPGLRQPLSSQRFWVLYIEIHTRDPHGIFFVPVVTSRRLLQVKSTWFVTRLHTPCHPCGGVGVSYMCKHLFPLFFFPGVHSTGSTTRCLMRQRASRSTS